MDNLQFGKRFVSFCFQSYSILSPEKEFEQKYSAVAYKPQTMEHFIKQNSLICY